MKQKRGEIGDWALGQGRRKSLLALGCLALAAQTHAALADITNSAVAVGNYNSKEVTSQADEANVPVTAGVASLSVTKTADPKAGVKAGDTITYTYVIKNTGNLTLTGITPTDSHNAQGPVPAPAGETLTDAGAADDSTDATADDGVWSVLAPGDTVTFTATYVVTQSDVDTLQ